MEASQASMNRDAHGRPSAATGGKYMAFKLAEEEYGLEILSVREIIGLMPITRVPRIKPYIRGVINLRGKIISVLDLRQRFGMTPVEATDQTVIIVVQCRLHSGREITMGILVDEVLEVLNIEGSQIAPPPHVDDGSIDQHFIIGVGKADKRVIFLLDIATVMQWEEKPAADRCTQAANE